VPYREERRLQCVAVEGAAIGGAAGALRPSVAGMGQRGSGGGTGLWGGMGRSRNSTESFCTRWNRRGRARAWYRHVGTRRACRVACRRAGSGVGRKWGGEDRQRAHYDWETFGHTAPQSRAGFPCGAEAAVMCVSARAVGFGARGRCAGGRWAWRGAVGGGGRAQSIAVAYKQWNTA
jgi:hypothetical protein